MWWPYQRTVRADVTFRLPADYVAVDLPVVPVDHGDEVVDLGLVPAALWDRVREAAINVFRVGQEVAAAAGLILVDTKYEFGLIGDRLVLIDEVHTPDSSRYWIANTYEAGDPQNYDKDMARWCRFGASPRATLALARCARARAWLQGEPYVSPEHIQEIAADILRHRLLLTFEAEAEGITEEEVIESLF